MTDIIKDIEETFVEQQNEIDQVRFNNDRKRYLDFRYQIHQNYDILTRNVYLMCKIQKGFDITADLNYFFGEEEEENNITPSEEYDELEEYQSRKYNPNRSRYDTKQRGYTEDEE